MALKVLLQWTSDDGTINNLDDFTRISVRKATDIAHNTMDVVLKNDKGSARPYISTDQTISFKPEQQINLYARFDDNGAGLSADNDYLLFAGRVVEFKCQTEETKAPITLKCSDSTYIAMNRLWVGDEEGTPPELIKGVIDFINHGLPSDKQITATLSATLPTPDGRIASVNSSGSAFDVTRTSKVFKPAYEIINDLSQPSITGDAVPYRFHVNRNNEFTWFYPSDTASHVIVEGIQTPRAVAYVHPVTGDAELVTDTVGHRVKTINLTYAVYDVVNFIIYKAGTDIDNTQILGFEYDATSGSPTENDAFRNWEDIARTVKYQEKNFFNGGTAGNLTYVEEDKYTINKTSGTTSWGQSYSSSSDYKTKFINFCKAAASARAQAEFRKTGNPRWKGTVELRGENNFDANDALIFSSPRHGIQNVFMRVKEVQHNIDKNGWFVTLTLDEET